MKLLRRFDAVILLGAMSLVSCSHTSEIKPILKRGINGEALYYYERDGSLSEVILEQYSRPGYTISIDNDSLAQGEEFAATIIVVPPTGASISIHKPTQTSMNLDTISYYSWKPSEHGPQEFEGILHYDSADIPFLYKFFVK